MTSEVREKRLFDNVFSRRRKRSSSNASGDSEFVLPGVRRDEMSKHRSCMVHTLNHEHGEQVTRKQAQEGADEYGISSDPILSQEIEMSSDPIPFLAPQMSSSPVQIPLQATKTGSDPISSQAKEMNSNSFAEHLERIWRSFPADKLVQCAYLECLWFGFYRTASNKTKVLSWINKKNIFSTDYVFIPICCWSHWNLLILCHFNERLNSKNRKPCMLLLDSLHLAGPTRLEMDIRKFVLDIYKAKGISGQRVYKIPLLVPKVPQQKHKECGYFALYFIKKFIEAIPKTISEDGLSFMEKDWFTRQELDGFCIELDKESNLQREVEASMLEKAGHESSEEDAIILHDHRVSRLSRRRLR